MAGTTPVALRPWVHAHGHDDGDPVAGEVDAQWTQCVGEAQVDGRRGRGQRLPQVAGIEARDEIVAVVIVCHRRHVDAGQIGDAQAQRAVDAHLHLVSEPGHAVEDSGQAARVDTQVYRRSGGDNLPVVGKDGVADLRIQQPRADVEAHGLAGPAEAHHLALGQQPVQRPRRGRGQ